MEHSGVLSYLRAMLARVVAYLLWLFCLTSAAHGQSSHDLTLVVDGDDTSATYFLSLPATELAPLLGTDPSLLFSAAGQVPIERFRQTGSFEQADKIFANVTGQQDGRPVAFEAMSLMVHPSETPLPFAAPWDAYTAISVCSVDYEDNQLLPEVLHVYYGGFTDQVSGVAPLEIHFPETGRKALSVLLHRYQDGAYIGSQTVTLSDGGAVVIARDAAPIQARILPGGGAILLICVAAALAFACMKGWPVRNTLFRS